MVLKATIDVVSKPYTGKLPHAVEMFMQLMDSIGAEHGQQWSFVGGFARDNLLGYEPHDFDVASWNNNFFRDKLSEIGCLRIGEQTEPRRKPHDYFSSPFEFNKKEYPIHWIEADMEAAFAPTRFDFTLNHFAMKSDCRIYAPTYAWKDVANKILRISKEAPRSTNVLLRAVRFSAKYGFEPDSKTFDFMHERIEHAKSGEDKMGNDIIIMNLNKIIEDDVGPRSLEILQELDFPFAKNCESIEELIQYNTNLILFGEGHREQRNDYEEQD